MFLDDRKKRILQAIVDDYIETAEPVGSRTIARKHQLGLSSATIRNEMADLEDMGYLAQPHTSAGRVPSDLGYRFYVDQLMTVHQLSDKESKNIEKAMEERINEVSQLLKLASNVMSRFTTYTSMAATTQMKKSTLKAVRVMPIESGKFLVVLVTNAGIVKNSIVKVPGNLSQDLLVKISNILNAKLTGLTIENIKTSVTKEIERETESEKAIVYPIINGLIDCINQVDSYDVYLEGTTNILSFPEFSDLEKARELFAVLSEKEVLIKLLKDKSSSSSINIQIGTENEIEKIRDCSLITATYSMGDVVIGSIGVIGPKRMKYEKVISSMDFIREKINKEISKLMLEEKE